MEKVKSKFELIRNLEDGWNGEKAKKFDVDFVNEIEKIVLGLDIEPQVYPTPNGTIQIEYEEENKYLEFEFSPENLKEHKAIAFCKWNKGKETAFEIMGDNLTESINILLEGYNNL